MESTLRPCSTHSRRPTWLGLIDVPSSPSPQGLCTCHLLFLPQPLTTWQISSHPSLLSLKVTSSGRPPVTPGAAPLQLLDLVSTPLCSRCLFSIGLPLLTPSTRLSYSQHSASSGSLEYWHTVCAQQMSEWGSYSPLAVSCFFPLTEMFTTAPYPFTGSGFLLTSIVEHPLGTISLLVEESV